MRVNRIALENTLAWRSLDLTLGETVSIFLGKNGSGKSSIIDGCRLGMLGTARGVARKDSRSLSTWGTDRYQVDLELVGRGEGHLRRTPSGLYAVDGDGHRFTLTQGKLDDLILGDSRVLEVVFDAMKAVRMEPDDLRALVYQVAGVEVTDEDLRARGLEDEDVRAHALAGRWKKAEALARERRLERERQAGAYSLETPEDPLVGAPGHQQKASEVDDLMLSQVKDSIAPWEAELEQLGREIAAAEAGQAPDLARLEATLTERRAAHDRAIASYNQDEHDRARKEVVKRGQEGLELRNRYDDLRRGMDEHDVEFRRAEAKVKALEAWDRKCTCSHCGSVHDRPEAREPSEEEIRAAREQRTAAEASLARIRTSVEEAREGLEKANARVAELNATIDTLDGRRDELIRATESVDEAHSALSSARLRQEEAGGRPVNVEDLRSKRAALETKLGVARNIVADVTAYRTVTADLEANREKRDRLVAAARIYGIQEQHCRPAGLQAELLRSSLGMFTARLSQVSRLLFEGGGNVAGVVLEDDFTIAVVDRAGEIHPLETLNRSVVWRAAVSLADAISFLAGTRFMVLDDLGDLDHENRAVLMGFLYEVKEDYDQILVANVLTVDAWPTQAPEGSGFRVYRLADQQCVPV